MTDPALLARFEAARPQLGALAYRMLGSLDDAEDAVQEAWLRLNTSVGRAQDGEEIANLDAWLTTVVARICLNMLRDRRGAGHEERLGQLPDPIVDAVGEFDPEHHAMLADAVGLALFVVLDTLPPAERLAFVLHDVFAVPFNQIAPIVERSPGATRKLASRARRRIERAAPFPDGDIAVQREVADAFFAAGRTGDFERLVSVLHPDVVLRGDFGPNTRGFRAQGASSVARLAESYAGPEREVLDALVNGAAGAIIVVAGRPSAVMGFLVRAGRITAIDVLADPERIAKLKLSGHNRSGE
ncbi:RNA polymerase sigma factor SigJ [Mycobacterium basiliense]|uniref:RNA polymerase sigma factor SigJ n=1 Tax=Mycobacterium basiliense TaxID=2094119 RepID=A0A447GGT9_9MYCO|nr:sigma-70 family RNA polymerase sigma factor [Mycobacterium basiliense]VDM89693.1 RNA polymerase sigma factor SigJ [Mycobacterium basiliense]